MTVLARQQGVLDSPWTVYLFDAHRGPHMTVDPSGGWMLGEEGGIVYASSQQPGICRASNTIVARVRFALIEELER